jgi:hypothetical protein
MSFAKAPVGMPIATNPAITKKTVVKTSNLRMGLSFIN